MNASVDHEQPFPYTVLVSRRRQGFRLAISELELECDVSHSQNVTGYPWRVQDIMASDACLVSDPALSCRPTSSVLSPLFEQLVITTGSP